MQGIKNLTHGSINRQLFNLAMPIMATSFIQMAYSLTDMAWVGRLGSEAVAAIGSVGILTWMSGSTSLLNKVGSEYPYVGEHCCLYWQALLYVSTNSLRILPTMP